jgi:hypothetical protein
MACMRMEMAVGSIFSEDTSEVVDGHIGLML